MERDAELEDLRQRVYRLERDLSLAVFRDEQAEKQSASLRALLATLAGSGTTFTSPFGIISCVSCCGHATSDGYIHTAECLVSMARVLLSAAE